MHIFLSAGEPSGDLHGANLARALRDQCPNVTLAGLGGERMQAAGCNLIYPLADHAIMGLNGILRALPTMVRLGHQVTSEFRGRRPDAVVLIDYPGFHWHLAKRAKALGIPVVYFVPPQIWAWASHRVRKVRTNFAQVLCSLPFEERWYRARGVPANYIGHPYFDELASQQLDAAFLADQRRRGGPVVGILPGSRRGEIDRNLDWLVGTMKAIHAAQADSRFLVACLKVEHRDRIAARLRGVRLPAEAVVGRTPEVIARADACVAVSGSVGLELLYRRVPSVVVYRVNPFDLGLIRLLVKVRYMSIVNLLAGRELFPEFLSTRADPTGPATHILRWLNNPSAADSVRAELGRLVARFGQPGACTRAARAVIDLVSAARVAA